MEQVLHLSTIPPSTNNLFKTAGKRRVRSEQYSMWAATAAWEVKAQKPRKFLDDVSVTVELKRPRSNADIDNRIKASVDLLTGLVIADDRQVVEVTARWVKDIEGCRITIRAVPDE